MQRRAAMMWALCICFGTLALFSKPSRAEAQGCEPIRFTTPVNLGAAGEAYQPAHEWQITLAYRRLLSNEFFVDTREQSWRATGGQAPIIRVHTVIADVAYAINDRYRVSLSVPMSTGSFKRIWADGLTHEQKATGLGDMSLRGDAWLFAPRTHADGNIELGVGLKAPTGNNKIAGKFYTAAGAIDWPAEQPIQPGDGDWGILLNGQAFRRMTERALVYASGTYLVSPRAHTNVRPSPTIPNYWSVPDVYSARAGVALAVVPDHGLTLSLGGRADGTPVHDLIGAADDSTIKRTFYVIYADPGLSLSRGRESFTLSVPYRLRVNRMKSMLERQFTDAQIPTHPEGLNAGGFAKYLVFATYTHRF